MSFRSYGGNTHSENGWRICNSDELVTVNVAGMGLPVRRGPAALVLKAWVNWYHQNVEPIDRYKPLDDWGWSRDNAVSNSNHLSGTAVDLNATQYPWGARVMPADRIAKVRRGLKLFEGMIFWGADWDRADEMHYQLGAGTAAGDGASQRLIDFVARKCPNGVLLEGPPPDTGPDAGFYEVFLGPLGSDLKDSRAQLTGGRDAGQYPGWKQLGRRTVVDGAAALLKAAGA